MSANAVLDRIEQRLDEIKKSGATAEQLAAFEQRVHQLEQELSRRPGVIDTGLSEKEKRDFRFCRLIWSIKKGDRKLAPLEWDAVEATHENQRAIARSLPDAEARSATLDDDESLGNLVPPEIVSEIIPLIREKMVLDELGVAQPTGLIGSKISQRRTKAGHSFYWVAESEVIPASTAKTERMIMTPHAGATITELSNTLLAGGGDGGVEQWVRDQMIQDMAIGIQQGYFAGTGAQTQPLGVINQPGITSVAIGGALTPANLIDLANQHAFNDATMFGTPRWVFHSRAWAKIQAIAASDVDNRTGMPWLTVGNPALGAPPTFLGMPYTITNAVPYNADDNETDVLLGNWDQTVLGTWGQMGVDISSEAGEAFKRNETHVRAVQLVDVGVKQPKAIVVGTGVDVS